MTMATTTMTTAVPDCVWSNVDSCVICKMRIATNVEAFVEMVSLPGWKSAMMAIKNPTMVVVVCVIGSN